MLPFLRIVLPPGSLGACQTPAAAFAGRAHRSMAPRTVYTCTLQLGRLHQHHAWSRVHTSVLTEPTSGHIGKPRRTRQWRCLAAHPALVEKHEKDQMVYESPRGQCSGGGGEFNEATYDVVDGGSICTGGGGAEVLDCFVVCRVGVTVGTSLLPESRQSRRRRALLHDGTLPRLSPSDSSLPICLFLNYSKMIVFEQELSLCGLNHQASCEGVQEELNVLGACDRIVSIFWSEIVAKRAVFPKLFRIE